MPTTPRTKIAILGGGLGALASAFELTSQPGWKDRYEVTVYQKGWRLGGKGASGRGDNDRIEEHGLHCFWGFYDNAFSMLRTCYAEVNRQSGPIKTLEDAFKKLSSVHFIDEIDGHWCRYEMSFPDNGEKPGGGERLTDMPVADLVKRFIGQVREMLREHDDVGAHFAAALGGDLEEKLRWLQDRWHDLVAGGLDLLGRDAARAQLDQLRTTPPPDAVGDRNEAYRRRVLFQAAKFAFIALFGLIVDGMPSTLDGFTKFDVKDLRQWLRDHGADDDLLASPIVRGLYDASFCFPKGDFSHGDLAAGVSLRTVLLMGFTYKGAFMWKMQASMGDVVFAPLYEALRRRGVTFKFFHRTTKLSLAVEAGRSVIDTIAMDEQARTKNGPYSPLMDVRGLPCWPAKPLLAQLENGPALSDLDLESDWSPVVPVAKATLVRGKDFDHVVLAIPVAALPAICEELIESSPAWRNMVERVQTIRTKSFQVWFKKTPEQQAWQKANRIMTDVYRDDFNSVADMYQTLPFESWASGTEPGGVVYFSTAMADDPAEPPPPNSAYPVAQDAVVEQEARAFLGKYQGGIFGWLGDTYEPAAYQDHYFRANINPDQRYTLSVANSTAYRIPPDKTGFDNLFIAGDWTKSPLDLGCAEGATMSGMIAGRGVVTALTRGRQISAGAAFIEYPGMPVYPPAYHQKDITLCQFVLEANPKKMQEVLDRYLNVVGDPRPFRALGKWVLLQTGHIASNSSDFPGDAFGHGSETSAAFLVPVVRWRGWGSPGASPIEVGFFAPIIFVDQALSLVAGREVLGMAKHLAAFEPDGGSTNLDALTVRTMVVREHGQQRPVEMQPILRIQRVPGAGSAPVPDAHGFAQLVRQAIGTLSGWAPLAETAVTTLLQRLLTERKVRFFSLRQLRDRMDPTRAAFQEVTRGRMRLGQVQLQPMAEGHTIEIMSYASHRIARLLGLAEGPLTPAAQLKVHIDEATLDSEP